MKLTFEQNTALCLVIGSMLMTLTMVLHPAAGSLAQLVKTKNIIIISHAIAIFAVPILMVGYLGLMKIFGSQGLFSVLSFIVTAQALVCGLIAATINGLALPILAQDLNQNPAASGILPYLVRNDLALNHAFDYVFIGAMCLGTLLWSITLLISRKLPAFIAYMGIVLFALSILLLATGILMINLSGFRFFIVGQVIWILVVAIALAKSSAKAERLASKNVQSSGNTIQT